MKTIKDVPWNSDDDTEYISDYKSQFAIGFDVVKTHDGKVNLGIHLGFWTFDFTLSD